MTWIEAAEARCAAATAGPWSQYGTIVHAYTVPCGDIRYVIRSRPYGANADDPAVCADAAFIAHGRTDLPRALRLLREAEWLVDNAPDWEQDVLSHRVEWSNRCDSFRAALHAEDGA